MSEKRETLIMNFLGVAIVIFGVALIVLIVITV